MLRSFSPCLACLALTLLVLAAPGNSDGDGWLDLSSAARALDAWQTPTGDWLLADQVAVDANNPRLLTARPGQGILVNGLKGRTTNLLTKEKFIDIEARLEFLIPKGSNSGVKFNGLYEIQIVDSADRKELTGDSCGGIYPRAEEQPKYHHIDKGVPPRVNAAKPAGTWQVLHVIFQSPRFDAEGKKVANARFVKVVLNDQLIHENVEVLYPTGAAWRLRPEVASGPLFLQADHGPVAFRNVKVRHWTGPSKP